VAALFAITLFVSATLLFWVEPMIAKMILPRLGGTPAVWNSCLVFFQTMLLTGYTYAHISSARLTARQQRWLHTVVLLVPLAFMPLGLRDWTPPSSGNPVGWLLLLLLVSVGFPFFVLSTTAPLLQKWYASTGSPKGNDPYFLYAASNLGSLLALLGYPILIEPWLPLQGTRAWLSQAGLWTLGYGLFCVLVFACMATWHRLAPAHETTRAPAPAKGAKAVQRIAPPAPVPALRLRWIELAFVPSSLLLGITTFVTQDIAAIPLLWVIPLSLYLLSFIVVFAHWPERCQRVLQWTTPFLIVLTLFLVISGLEPGIIFTLVLHLLTFFAICLLCHGDLARTRPPAEHLTGFYLLISLGGVLGGLFNALLAPVLFASVFEYEAVLVLACLLLPSPPPTTRFYLERRLGWPASPWRARFMDALAAFLLGVIALDLLVFYASEGLANSPPLPGPYDAIQRWLSSVAARGSWSVESLWKLGLYGLPLAICLCFQRRPLRFGLALAAFVFASRLNGPLPDQGRDAPALLHQQRTFFSVLRVEQEGRGTPAELHVLMHGTTLHGQQFLHPSLKQEPLTYYTRSGPVGQIMRLVDLSKKQKKFGLIGLGAGVSGSYGRQGDTLVCYEIDNAVVKIAKDPKYFTYLSDCAARGCRVETVLGDARLRLREAPDRAYDVLIVDAFSSDAVPIHLITRQAFELYMQKLAPDGYLLIHVSNRYLNLDPVVGNIARDLGLTAFSQHDDIIDLPGKLPSDWIVVVMNPELLKRGEGTSRWIPIEANDRVGVWTDDYSNLLRVFTPK
jgi:hypothetical protein